MRKLYYLKTWGKNFSANNGKKKKGRLWKSQWGLSIMKTLGKMVLLIWGGGIFVFVCMVVGFFVCFSLASKHKARYWQQHLWCSQAVHWRVKSSSCPQPKKLRDLFLTCLLAQEFVPGEKRIQPGPSSLSICFSLSHLTFLFFLKFFFLIKLVLISLCVSFGLLGNLL